MAEENGVVKVNGVECKTLTQMIMYKIDRTLAIGGIIALGIVSMSVTLPTTGVQIVNSAISALAVYIGGRTVSK